MIKIIKNDESGFTLLEAIVSIGVLALLSAFILQMFIVSAGANQRASAIDIACAESVSAIDLFQGGDSAAAFLTSGFVTGDCDITESAAEINPLTLVSYHIERHYRPSGGAKFRIVIDIKPSEISNNQIAGFSGALYEIKVAAIDESAKMNRYITTDEANAERELISFTAKKYFGE